MNGKRAAAIRREEERKNPHLPKVKHVTRPFNKGFIHFNSKGDAIQTDMQLNQVFLNEHCLKYKVKQAKKKYKQERRQ